MAEGVTPPVGMVGTFRRFQASTRGGDVKGLLASRRTTLNWQSQGVHRNACSKMPL